MLAAAAVARKRSRDDAQNRREEGKPSRPRPKPETPVYTHAGSYEAGHTYSKPAAPTRAPTRAASWSSDSDDSGSWHRGAGTIPGGSSGGPASYEPRQPASAGIKQQAQQRLWEYSDISRRPSSSAAIGGDSRRSKDAHIQGADDAAVFVRPLVGVGGDSGLITGSSGSSGTGSGTGLVSVPTLYVLGDTAAAVVSTHNHTAANLAFAKTFFPSNSDSADFGTPACRSKDVIDFIRKNTKFRRVVFADYGITPGVLVSSEFWKLSRTRDLEVISVAWNEQYDSDKNMRTYTAHYADWRFFVEDQYCLVLHYPRPVPDQSSPDVYGLAFRLSDTEYFAAAPLHNMARVVTEQLRYDMRNPAFQIKGYFIDNVSNRRDENAKKTRETIYKLKSDLKGALDSNAKSGKKTILMIDVEYALESYIEPLASELKALITWLSENKQTNEDLMLGVTALGEGASTKKNELVLSALRGLVVESPVAGILMRVNGGTGVGSTGAYHPGRVEPRSADAGPADPSPVPPSPGPLIRGKLHDNAAPVDRLVFVSSDSRKCAAALNAYRVSLGVTEPETYKAADWKPLKWNYKNPTRVVIYVDEADIMTVHEKLSVLDKAALQSQNISMIQYLYTKDENRHKDKVQYIIPPDLFDDNTPRSGNLACTADGGTEYYMSTPIPRTGPPCTMHLVTRRVADLDDHIKYHKALKIFKTELDREKSDNRRIEVVKHDRFRRLDLPQKPGMLVIDITSKRSQVLYSVQAEDDATYKEEADLVKKLAPVVTDVMFVYSDGSGGRVNIGGKTVNLNAILPVSLFVDTGAGSAGAGGGSRVEQPSVPIIELSALPDLVPDLEPIEPHIISMLPDLHLSGDVLSFHGAGTGASLIEMKARNVGLEDELAEGSMLKEAGLEDAHPAETKKQGATTMTRDQCIKILENEMDRRLGTAEYRDGTDAKIVKILVERAKGLIAPLGCNIIIRGKNSASEQRVKDAAAIVFNRCVKRAEKLSAEVADLKSHVYTNNVITELERMVGAETQEAIKAMMGTSLADLKATRNLLTREQVIGARKARKETPSQRSAKDEAQALFDDMKKKAEETVNRIASDASNIALVEMVNDSALAEKGGARVEKKAQGPGVGQDKEQWDAAFLGYIKADVASDSEELKLVISDLLSRVHVKVRRSAMKEKRAGEQAAATLLPEIKAEAEKIIQEKSRHEEDAKREEERKREEQERKREELERALARRRNNSATRIQALQRGRAARKRIPTMKNQREEEQRKEEQRRKEQRKEEQRKAAEQRNAQEAAKIAYVVASGPQVSEDSVKKVIEDRQDIFAGYKTVLLGEYDSTVEHLNNPNAVVIIATNQAASQIADKSRYLPIMCKEIYIKDATLGVASRLESAGYKKQSQKAILTLTGNRESYTKFTFLNVPVSWYSTNEWSLSNVFASADCTLAGASTSKEYVAGILDSIANETREISRPGNLKENDDPDLRSLGYVLVSCVDKDKLKKVADQINVRMPRKVLILGTVEFMNSQYSNVSAALSKYNVSGVRNIETKVNAPKQLKDGKVNACVLATLRSNTATGGAAFGRPGIMMRFV